MPRPPRHYVAHGHQRGRFRAGDRALALWPRPVLPPSPTGAPLSVRTVWSSWQSVPRKPGSRAQRTTPKRSTTEWRAKVSAGTRAALQTKPSRWAVSGIGRRPGFVVSEATRAKMRAAALRRTRERDADAR